MTDVVHGRRLTPTNGAFDNDLERWRALFVENEDGAEQVTIGWGNIIALLPTMRQA